jgi:cation transport regulator
MAQDDVAQTQPNTSAEATVDSQLPIHDQMPTGEQPANAGQAIAPLSADTLPEEVRNRMPKDAQQIFIAAYNSILQGNNDPEAANRVAWQTIDHSEQFAKGEDGVYQRVAGIVTSSAPSPLSAS